MSQTKSERPQVCLCRRTEFHSGRAPSGEELCMSARQSTISCLNSYGRANFLSSSPELISLAEAELTLMNIEFLQCTGAFVAATLPSLLRFLSSSSQFKGAPLTLRLSSGLRHIWLCTAVWDHVVKGERMKIFHQFDKDSEALIGWCLPIIVFSNSALFVACCARTIRCLCLSLICMRTLFQCCS